MARPRYVGTVLALGASSCMLLEAIGYPSGSLRTLSSYCEGSPRYIRRFSEGLCLLSRRFRAIEDAPSWEKIYIWTAFVPFHLTSSISSAFRHREPGDHSGGPRGLEIEAARHAIDVQHFA